MNSISRTWPTDTMGRVPYWVYSDPDIYAAELERIWYGPHWLYCGLEAEIPNVGDFKTTTIGERPVIMTRSGPDEINVVENRCAHRGLKFCQVRKGNAKDLLCPYHQWNYSLRGDLQGAAFRRGVRGQGGMPADFDPKDHGLRKLRVAAVNGVVWPRSPMTRPVSANISGSGSGSTTLASTTGGSWRSSATTASTLRATGN